MRLTENMLYISESYRARHHSPIRVVNHRVPLVPEAIIHSKKINPEQKPSSIPYGESMVMKSRVHASIRDFGERWLSPANEGNLRLLLANVVHVYSIGCPWPIYYMYVIICASRDKGPGAVVKAACLESRRSWVRLPLRYSSFKETKCFFLPRSLVKI